MAAGALSEHDTSVHCSPGKGVPPAASHVSPATSLSHEPSALQQAPVDSGQVTSSQLLSAKGRASSLHTHITGHGIFTRAVRLAAGSVATGQSQLYMRALQMVCPTQNTYIRGRHYWHKPRRHYSRPLSPQDRTLRNRSSQRRLRRPSDTVGSGFHGARSK